MKYLDSIILAWPLPISLTMSLTGKGVNGTEWEALFHKETPYYKCDSIATMEDEIYGEFKLRLGPEVTILNYWRLEFILA